MGAVAILPVKRFGSAKQRLAATVGARARAELAAAMLDDVLRALRDSRELERVIVVSGEPVAQGATRRSGAELVSDPDDAGHSEAAARGVARALELGARAAVLLPGDCPLLDAGELDSALRDLPPRHVGVVPDRHGTGTNALLLAPPDAIEPAFGEGSRARHLGLAQAAGVPASVMELRSLALDIDTPQDLEAVAAALGEPPPRAPSTSAALRASGGSLHAAAGSGL